MDPGARGQVLTIMLAEQVMDQEAEVRGNVAAARQRMLGSECEKCRFFAALTTTSPRRRWRPQKLSHSLLSPALSDWAMLAGLGNEAVLGAGALSLGLDGRALSRSEEPSLAR